MSLVPANTGLCQSLIDLAQKRQENNEIYSAKAYSYAANICQNYTTEITSSEQLKGIRGIGPKIINKIDEYLNTEQVTETAKLANKPELELFQQIEGVGPVTAEKWYKRGYRSIDDLPWEDLTAAQQIGVKFFDDLQSRIPREEIEFFENALRRYLRRDGGNLFHKEPGISFTIAGSYRRGKDESGDIDILVRDSDKVLTKLLKCPLFTYTLAKGKKKWRGIGKIRQKQRRIDIEIVQPKEYPFALLYFTGSAKHNIEMRENARLQGYRLNEKGLFDENGNIVPGLQTEADVYQFLSMEYLSPTERDF